MDSVFAPWTPHWHLFMFSLAVRGGNGGSKGCGLDRRLPSIPPFLFISAVLAIKLTPCFLTMKRSFYGSIKIAKIRSFR
tara:strand:- start:478 stop:714 length:237 start_codon:yes stop_codon:yes gene_type:complete